MRPVSLPKSVLLVDDHPIVRRALRRLFTMEGIDVCGEAENGEVAIQQAQALSPDLIVMDFSMPVMNGLEAAKALRTLMPGVSIIMFSQHRDLFSNDVAESAGICALISKSEHISVLIAKAKSLLNGVVD